LNSNEVESEVEPDIEDAHVSELVLNEKKNIKVKDKSELGATSAKPKGKPKGKSKNVKTEDIAKESEDELVEDEYD
jgi:hypothetical protein